MAKSIINGGTANSSPDAIPAEVMGNDGIKFQDNPELVSWIKSAYDAMKASRMQPQRQWYINLAMYYGRQYLEVFSKNGMTILGIPKAPNHRVRHSVNLIRPMIRTEIARLTSQKPVASVTPATTSDDDMFAAQAAEQVWEYLQQRRQYQQTMLRNAFWTSIAGTSFVKTWWDNDLVDPNTFYAGTTEPAKGDVCFGVSTPFNIFVPDLLEWDVEGQPYIFEAYTRSVSWVKKFWGIDASPNVASKSEIIETSYFNVQGGNSAKEDAVLVIECWVKPGGSTNSSLSDGGMVTLVGDKVTAVQPLYSHGEFPYAKSEHIPTGKFYADSVLVDINPLQKEYNRLRSQIIEARNKMGNPQLLYPEGSIDPYRLTNEPGLLIPFRPGLGTPTPLSPPPIPAYILQDQAQIKEDMEDISGQHQVTRGNAPGAGVTAATAISYLQERDDSIMGTTYDSIEFMTEKIARHALTLAVDYYSLPRTIQTTGLDQSFDSLELKGADIAAGKNLRVEAGSALPTSKPARQALLMDMVKFGIISGDQFIDLLDVGGIQNLSDRIRTDKRQAQRENLKMKRLTAPDYEQWQESIKVSATEGGYGSRDPNTGVPLVDPAVPATYPPFVPVNNWDNHVVHIATHNDYRKSQEFDTLPPFVKYEFEKHVEQHQMALGLQQQSAGMPPAGMTPQGMPQGAPFQGNMAQNQMQNSPDKGGPPPDNSQPPMQPGTGGPGGGMGPQPPQGDTGQ